MKRAVAIFFLCGLSQGIAQNTPAEYDIFWQAPVGTIFMLNGNRIEGEEIKADYYPTSCYLPIRTAKAALKAADVLGVICQPEARGRDAYLLVAILKDGNMLIGTDNRSWYYTERNPDAVFWKSTASMGSKFAKEAKNASPGDTMQFFSAINSTPNNIMPIFGDANRISYYKRAIQTLDLQIKIRK